MIVGHLHTHDHGGDHDHGSADHRVSDAVHPPEKATATADSITRLLEPDEWDVITAEELSRTLQGGSGRSVELHDVVVRAARRAGAPR